jgi:hypothetical protein
MPPRAAARQAEPVTFDRAAAGRPRAARTALAWVVVFTAFHIYWYLGGSFASPGALPGTPHSVVRWAFDAFVGIAFVTGLLVPLAIARGWTDRRSTVAALCAVLVWAGAVLLVLRGGAGIVDDLTRAAGVRTGITGLTTKETTGMAQLTWSGWAIDSYFLLGGLLFTWLGVSDRPRPRSRPYAGAERG